VNILDNMMVVIRYILKVIEIVQQENNLLLSLIYYNGFKDSKLEKSFILNMDL
jgi:hypothetical protein